MKSEEESIRRVSINLQNGLTNIVYVKRFLELSSDGRYIRTLLKFAMVAHIPTSAQSKALHAYYHKTERYLGHSFCARCS